MKKRGLSAVVTNLILILLVLIAIAVVWVVVQNLLGRTSEDITLDRITLDLEIQSASVDGTDVLVNVKRVAGAGDLAGIHFILKDSVGKTFSYSNTSAGAKLDEYASGDFTIPADSLGTVVEVSVSPMFGNDKVGNVVSSWSNFNVICFDSDGGENLDVRGNTTGLNSAGILTTNTDYCRDQNYVMEGYCQNKINYIGAYSCPLGKGCVGGVCR